MLKTLYLLVFLFSASLTDTLAQSSDKNYNKGLEAYRKGNYPEAILQMEIALKKENADSALICNALGDVYYYWQNYNNAIRYYHKAIQLKYPGVLETYFMLSTVYYNKKNFQLSLDFCNLILATDPLIQDAKVYWRMNLIYSLADQPDKALDIIKTGARNGISELQNYCTKRNISWKL